MTTTTRAGFLKRVALIMAGLFVLGFATAAYLRPEFMVDLGNRIMLCF